MILITETTFKDFSTFDANLSWNYVKPILQFVQDKWMVQLLGRNFYNELLEQAVNDTLTPENSLLIDEYIKHILIWNTMADIQVPLSYKFRNQGYVQNQNQDGSNLSLEDMKYTKNFYANTASFYNRELIEFLKLNRKDYPLWKCIEPRAWDPNINI